MNAAEPARIDAGNHNSWGVRPSFRLAAPPIAASIGKPEGRLSCYANSKRPACGEHSKPQSKVEVDPSPVAEIDPVSVNDEGKPAARLRGIGSGK